MAGEAQLQPHVRAGVCWERCGVKECGWRRHDLSVLLIGRGVCRHRHAARVFCVTERAGVPADTSTASVAHARYAGATRLARAGVADRPAAIAAALAGSALIRVDLDAVATRALRLVERGIGAAEHVVEIERLIDL